MNLQILWFVLIAVVWSGYFLLEGFDFGVGMLLPFLPRDESQRQAMFNSIGPVWDGNEVWLVVAGGAMFAAFPAWYATMFSGYYLALLLVLVCLIVRVVSFEWRTKTTDPRWRAVWTWANAIGSFGASFVWGVGLSALVYGVPIDQYGNYTGNFWSLFSVYTVLAGVAVVLVFAFHGATYLTLKTTGELLARATSAARQLSLLAAAGGAAFLVSSVFIAVNRNDKTVFPPVLPAALGIAALLLAALFVMRHRMGLAFAMTGLGAILVVATLFTSLYPRVMVSSSSPVYSLTVQSAASQHYTLAVISVVALICLPLVLLYQGWTYHVFRHRVGDAPTT